jgi:hypothetical protein
MRKSLQIIFSIILLFTQSCDLSEIASVRKVSFVSNGTYLLPLAYGDIQMQTVFDVSGLSDIGFIADSEGYYKANRLIEEFQVEDTLSFNSNVLKTLSHFKLRIETENKIPLEIKLELNFFDSLVSTKLGPPIDFFLVAPPKMNEQGKAIASTNNVEIIELSAEQMEAYQQASFIFYKIDFSLPQSNSDKIMLHPSDFLTINIGTIVKLNKPQNEE